MAEHDVDEVSLFLGELGLNEDAEKLRKEDVSMEILMEMTTDDLRKMGITFGHSFQIRKALDKSMKTDENRELESRSTTKERRDLDDERASDIASEEESDESLPASSVREKIKFNQQESITTKCTPTAVQEGDKTTNLRVILVGKTGTGKSATANSILGGPFFSTSSSGSSITERCTSEWANRFGRKIQVIDTPGLFDTSLSQDEIEEEIMKCIALSAPGPHAFILVLNISRFTREEEETAMRFFELFENAVFDYFIVLFTRLDDLEYEGKTLSEHLLSIPKNLESILAKCQGRYIAFNNRDTDEKKDRQVEHLLGIIDDNLLGKETKYYTDEMFQEAERILKAKEEAMKRVVEYEREQKYEILRNEIEDKYKEIQTNLGSRLAKINESYCTTETYISATRKEIADFIQKMKDEKKMIENKAKEIESKKNIELKELENKRKKEKIHDDPPRDGILQSIKNGGTEVSDLFKSVKPIKCVKKFFSKFFNTSA